MRWLIGLLTWCLEKAMVFLAHLGERRGKRRRRPTTLEFVLRASRIARRVRDGDAVLDVGCGAGRALTEIGMFREIRPFGVDVSLDRYAFREIPVARFDGRRLPFAEGSFDVTVCCYVLHHLTPQHARELLGEMVRVTRRRIVVLEDSLPRFDWFYRLRNRFHRINAAALYGGESATYRPPRDEAMFLTHDQWSAFAADIAGVSHVAIESLQDITRWRHHTLIDLTVGPAAGLGPAS
jgi:SAM-dependent methyltransferase